MIIQCPGCRKKYKYDEARFKGEETKKIKCPHCGTVFEITNPKNRKKKPDATTAVHSTKSIGDIQKEVAKELLRRKRISIAFLSGKLAGQVFEIRESPVTIGRSDCDIELDDPECSRKHAELSIQANGVYLKDLESTNGTFMDGIRITEVKLKDKDEFRIGSISMMLIIRDREEDIR
ncbi:MAG: FHA domain-containing protein [Acidobacteria bacterium]|nr:FHA domain-containing protein [Acidobacteriota bacterium]